MEGESFVGGLQDGIRFLTDVMFRWIPGTVQVMSGTAPDMGERNFTLTPITEPVTTADVLGFLQTTASAEAYDGLYQNWAVLVSISVLITLLLLAAIIYCIVRILQVRHTEELRVRAAAHSVAAKDVPKTQLRWNRIREQIASEDEQQWRLAILEADIMLNELLDILGYKGETMADKLKSVERGDFKSIDLAWEAHRVRNAIAHQGTMQELTSREARRVIGMYEQVFKEFKFVE